MLDDLLLKVEAETRQMAKSMDIALPEANAEAPELLKTLGVPSEFLLKTAEVTPAQEAIRYPSGKPHNARDLLLTGVQDVTQMLTSDDYKLNDLILLVLETLYTSMGFRFATVCLRDISSGRRAPGGW
jgi:hypothetical protein